MKAFLVLNLRYNKYLMEARDTTRKEFMKQPHVVFIILLILIALITAIYTAAKRTIDSANLSKVSTFEACHHFINDENLCKYAQQNEKDLSASKKVTITESERLNLEKTVIQIENLKKYKIDVYSGDQLEESIINVGDTVYTRKKGEERYTYENSTVNDLDDNKYNYDFTRENSEDVLDFKNNYKYIKKEKCHQMECYKYRLNYKEEPETEAYIWFDTKGFRARKLVEIKNKKSLTTTYAYMPISIEIPKDAIESDELHDDEENIEHIEHVFESKGLHIND